LISSLFNLRFWNWNWLNIPDIGAVFQNGSVTTEETRLRNS